MAAVADVRIQPHKAIDSTLIVCLRNTGENLIRDLRFELLLPLEIPGIGCFSCDESEMLHHEDKVWIKFVIPSLPATCAGNTISPACSAWRSCR